MAHREHGASRTWRITNMAHHEHGASRTWCITNMAHHEHGASRTWCVERCPEGALANSRWEASGFMLAHPPDQRVPEPAPAGAADPHHRPRAMGQRHHDTAAPAGAEILWGAGSGGCA